MKYSLNKISIKLWTQQVGWLGGQGVELHPWGPRINFHKRHALLSTLEYWPNIPYLSRLLKLRHALLSTLEYWPNIPYLSRLLKLSDYLGKPM